MMRWLVFSSLLVGLLAQPPPHPRPMRPPTGLMGLLEEVTEWTMTLNLRTNNLTGVEDKLSTSIFINGNLARVLLASYLITGNITHRNEALAWCDTFVQLQHKQRSGKFTGVAGWWDTGYSQLYIADTGTAVTTLALCYDVVQDDRRQVYMDRLTSFDVFVRSGTAEPPLCTFKPGCAYGNTTADGFLIDAGPDAGALGDGYYKGRLNTEPYTIATATTGGAFYAEMSALGPPEARQIYEAVAVG